MPYRKQDSHKGTFGQVLNFAGSKNYIGAAYLSSLSVLKVGAGLVALSSSKEVINTISKLLPEAIYLSQQDALKKIKEFSTIILGCGFGTCNKSFKIFKKVILYTQKTNTPLILDADGLNLLAKKNVKLSPNTIITPHPKEAARLLNVSLNSILENPENSAKKLSDKYNCITVLKIHRTIICNQNKEFHVNKNGNSALAKAGSGDVLAGIIAGLIAQKMSLYDAAKLGVYLHARTGEILSKSFSEYSILASQIAENIHSAILELI